MTEKIEPENIESENIESKDIGLKKPRYKKIAIYTISTLMVSLLIIAISIPRLYESQVRNLIMSSVSNMLKDGELSMEEIDISFFREFPRADIAIYNTQLISNSLSINDTIVNIERVNITIGLLRFLKNDLYLDKFRLSKPRIKLFTNREGESNWDIFKEDSTDIQSDTIEFSLADKLNNLSIDINQLEISDGLITYLDKVSNSAYIVPNLNTNISSKISANRIDFNSTLSTEGLTLISDGSTFTEGSNLDLDIDLSADLLNEHYEIKHGAISYNDMPMQLSGTAKRRDSISFDVNVDMNSDRFDIDQLFTIATAGLDNARKYNKASGEFNMTVHSEGVLNIKDKLYPPTKVDIIVKDGNIKNSRVNKSINKINLDFSMLSGGDGKNTLDVDLRQCDLFIEDSPIRASLKANLNKVNSTVKGEISANMDIGELMDMFQIDFETQGVIDMDFRYNLNERDLRELSFDNILADGYINIDSLRIKSVKDSASVSIDNLEIEISPKTVKFKQLLLKLGDSDLDINGTIDNLFSYLATDRDLNIDLNMESNHINIDELQNVIFALQSAVSDEEIASLDSISSKAISEVLDSIPEPYLIPDNIQLQFNTNFKKVIDSDLPLEDISGIIRITKKELLFEDFKMTGLGGKIDAYGLYDTSNQDTLLASFGLILEDIDLAQFTKEIDNRSLDIDLDSISISGRLDTEFSIYTKTDALYNPIWSTTEIGGIFTIPTIEGGDDEHEYAMSNLNGNIYFYDKTLSIVSIRGKIFDGEATVKGEMDFASFDSIASTFTMNVKKWDINSTYKGLAPSFDQNPEDFSVEGDISGDLNIGLTINSDLQLKVGSVNAEGELTSEQFYLKESEALDMLLDSLEVPLFDEFNFTNAIIRCRYQNGLLYIDPSTVRLNKFLGFGSGIMNTEGDLLLGFIADVNKDDIEEGDINFEKLNDTVSTTAPEVTLSKKELKKQKKEEKKQLKRTLKGTYIMFGNIDTFDYKVSVKLNKVSPFDLLEEAILKYKEYAPKSKLSKSGGFIDFENYLEDEPLLIDTTEVEGDTLMIGGDTIRVEGDTLMIGGDTIRAESDTLMIGGDTIRVESNTLMIGGDTIRVEGDALIVESDTIRDIN